MSSMLCQGLQSCTEPRFVEPRALGLKLAPPKPFFSQPMEWARKSCTSDSSDSDIEEQNSDDDNNSNNNNNNNNNNDHIDTNKSISKWSLIEALTNMSQSPTNEEKETPYVHPLVKRYSSKLSEKSLELCTENLGSETGSDISENGDISSTNSSDSESSKSSTRDRKKMRHNWGLKNKLNSGSFPPPLTSISGSNCVQVRPHREGGRLVIKTVVVQTPQTYFQAERRDGRLRLRFLKKCDSSTLDSKLEEAVEEENYDVPKEQEPEPEIEEGTELDQEIEFEEETELDQEIDVEKDYLDEETEGYNGNVGGEMGIEKFQRLSRCKESRRGKNGLLIWEPFWVAT